MFTRPINNLSGLVKASFALKRFLQLFLLIFSCSLLSLEASGSDIFAGQIPEYTVAYAVDNTAVTTAFQAYEQDHGEWPQDQLMRHPSQDDERSWQGHYYNSIVGLENNSIHSGGIEHFPLWKAAPTSVSIEKQSTLPLNSNLL